VVSGGKWSRALFLPARVVIPSWFIRRISDAGCRCVPTFLPVNSHQESARVLAAPNGLATGSAVMSMSRGGISSSGSGPRVR
jgi:hypothetical protein